MEQNPSGNGSMMEALPADVMTKVLEFSVIPERLNLARCTTGLLHLITKECTSLWEKLEFYPYSDEYYMTQLKNESQTRDKWEPARMTDWMLKALLQRVNAKELTKFVCLRHCCSIQGHGLEPLRDSRVLKGIHAQAGIFAGQVPLDEQFVMDLCRTMLPFKLHDVKFDKKYSADATHRTNFYRDVRMAKYQQALESRAKCSSCTQPVAQESKQDVPNQSGLPSCRCSKCHGHFCRSFNCQIAMRDCVDCDKTSCQDCNEVRQCDKCKLSYCTACEYVPEFPCMECGKTFCIECDYEGHHCAKPGCQNILCSECAPHYNGEVSLFRCDECDAFYCEDCTHGQVCTSCEMAFCPDHCTSTECLNCDKYFAICNGCGYTSCDVCRGAVCSSCENFDVIPWCESCGQRACHECKTVTTCRDCGSSYCGECSMGELCMPCARENSSGMHKKKKRRRS